LPTGLLSTQRSLLLDDDTQSLAAGHVTGLMAKAPDFMTALNRMDNVAIEGRRDSIKADAIMAAAYERNVFCVGPA
jgi:hypothetical protein